MTLLADNSVFHSFDSDDSCDIMLHKQLPFADGCHLEARFLPAETLSLLTTAITLTFPDIVTIRSAYWQNYEPASCRSIKLGLLLRESLRN
jgi:hypothetical protein